MTDFLFRTEDIAPEDLQKLFVENQFDRQLVDSLKGRNPIILVGSRGVGKSFLLRVAQKEQLAEFQQSRVFPVYMTFVKSSLLRTSDKEQFKHWMLARICNSIVRSLQKEGVLVAHSKTAEMLLGGSSAQSSPSTLESIITAFEDSWQKPNTNVDISKLPTIEVVKDAIDDICTELNVKRFNLLVDEASHIMIPEQQRQFFTLFRDLRNHNLTCNAAVYPGVTSYGDTFQPAHDATMLVIDRDIQSTEYISTMREIVTRQADAVTQKRIAQNGQNFAILAYSASGNPRILLKTIAAAPNVSSSEVNEVIRQFFRTGIWTEHSLLAEKYIGHRPLIDWGREFIEMVVLPELKSKNDQYLASDKNTSAYFWIHRDAPEVVKEALRILCYTGVVVEQSQGMKATRAEIGTRFMVNLGSLFALESAPARTAFDVAKNLTPKRMTEFGSNHDAFKSLLEQVPKMVQDAVGADINVQLKKEIEVLDLTSWQIGKLKELNLASVGDVLSAPEAKLKTAYYVGDVRARQMRNAAIAAVLEYLSG